MTSGSGTRKKTKELLEAWFSYKMSLMDIKTICDSIGIKNMEN